MALFLVSHLHSASKHFLCFVLFGINIIVLPSSILVERTSPWISTTFVKCSIYLYELWLLRNRCPLLMYVKELFLQLPIRISLFRPFNLPDIITLIPSLWLIVLTMKAGHCTHSYSSFYWAAIPVPPWAASYFVLLFLPVLQLLCLINFFLVFLLPDVAPFLLLLSAFPVCMWTTYLWEMNNSILPSKFLYGSSFSL